MLARNPVAHMSRHCPTSGQLQDSVDTRVGRVSHDFHVQAWGECPSLETIGGKRARWELALVVLLAPRRGAMRNSGTWKLPRCCTCSATLGRRALFVVLTLRWTRLRTLAIPLVRLSPSLAFAIESGPLLGTAPIRAWHAVP